jgi:hypothetical protein
LLIRINQEKGMVLMSTIQDLLRGSIDMHVHTGPDPVMERSVDILQAAQQAHGCGMKALVFKSHEYPTAPMAYLINSLVPGFSTIGSISLDFGVGGLNPQALEISAKMGAKVVWMPTLCSDHDMQRRNPPQKGIRICDD